MRFQPATIDQLITIIQLPSDAPFRREREVLASRCLKVHLSVWLEGAEALVNDESTDTERPAEHPSTDAERALVNSSE